jgi:predicted ATPase/DNA-binding SARP family transcriptional activator
VTAIQIHVLGGLAFSEDGAAPVPVRRADLNTWVCALLAAADRPMSREEIAELLWPDLLPSAARNALRQRIWLLRESEYAPTLLMDEFTLSWTGGSDLRRFRDRTAVRDWSGALREYGGPLLQDLPFPLHKDFSDFLNEARVALRAEYLAALWATRHADGHPDDLAAHLITAHRLYPDEPEVLEELVRLLVRQGQHTEARHLLRQQSSRLRNDYGLPLPPALDTLRRSLESPGDDRPTQLVGVPVPLTSFVGRERETRAALAQLLHGGPDRRWLTVTGPGGVGKTRLAVHLAHAYAASSGQKVVFVPLAALSSPRQMQEALLIALADTPSDDDDLTDTIAQLLQSSPTLLILDNFEHLMPAADLLPTLLERAPTLRLLVTSRERLQVQAETVLRLGGLDDSGSGSTGSDSTGSGATGSGGSAHSHAGALFHERAARSDLNFDPARWVAAVQEILTVCEGLPLALELAAAQVGDLTPDDIARQLRQGRLQLAAPLRDLPPRHRSLQALFDYSWDALPPALQAGYAALAVLRSPFGAAAAHDVAGLSAEQVQTLERRSLLTLNGRYQWHENLREFALEKLTDQRLPVQDAHLRYLVGVAERLAPHLSGPAQVEALARLEAQHPDHRAALAHALARQDARQGLRLASALHWFWYVRGHHQEGLRWLEALLGLPPPPDGDAVDATRATALKAAGLLASERGQGGRAAEYYAAALDLTLQRGDRLTEADVRHLIGVLHRDEGRLAQAAEFLASASDLWAAAGDRSGAAKTLNDQGILHFHAGDRPAARLAFERSLALKREVGDLQGVAYALNNLSNITPDLTVVLDLQRESLEIKEALGDVHGSARSYANLGITLRDLGRHHESAASYARALTLYLRLGRLTGLGPTLLDLADLLLRLAAPASALLLIQSVLNHRWYGGPPLTPAHVMKANDLSRRAMDEGARPEGPPLPLEAALRMTLNTLGTFPDNGRVASTGVTGGQR